MRSGFFIGQHMVTFVCIGLRKILAERTPTYKLRLPRFLGRNLSSGTALLEHGIQTHGVFTGKLGQYFWSGPVEQKITHRQEAQKEESIQ